MRKMLSLTGMRSNEARISPVVVSGSIRGSLATILSLGFSFLVVFIVACRDQRQEEAEIAVDRLDHLRPWRGCCAHHVVFEADIDETGREQPRGLARIRRRNQAGECEAAKIVRHQALLARVKMVGEFGADAGHAVAFGGDDLLELVLARVGPLPDEIERELAAERNRLARELLVAGLLEPARRACGAVFSNDRFQDRGLAGEVVVEAALANADAARKLAHRGAAIAALREQIECLGENALAGR